MTNYAMFVSDPLDRFGSAEGAAFEINELVSHYSLGDVRVGLQSESGRIEELERMIGDHIDDWHEVKEAVKQLLADSDYWGHPPLSKLATFTKLATLLDIQDEITTLEE